MPDFEAVVSGGGIVGLAAAYTLTKAGYRTLVIDKRKAVDSQSSDNQDIRHFTLAPVALEQLLKLGMKLSRPCSEIHTMHIWEGEGSAAMTFSSEDVDGQCLAYVEEQSQLERALAEVESPLLTRMFESEITNLDITDRTVTINNEILIQTQLLIVAEGFQSSTCRQLQANYEVNQDLNSSAVCTRVKFSQPHQQTAWQVFNPTPLALLPTAEPFSMSIVWSLSNERAGEVLALDDNEFNTALSTECEQVAGTAQKSGPKVSFALAQSVISDFNPQDWVLILGDSARRIHPMAGQGINLGLEDVRVLDAVLASNPDSLCQHNLWRSFAEKRKIRSLLATNLMRFFSDVYGSDSPYLRLLRNYGVRLLNQSNSIKAQLIKEAMGTGPVALVQ